MADLFLGSFHRFAAEALRTMAREGEGKLEGGAKSQVVSRAPAGLADGLAPRSLALRPCVAADSPQTARGSQLGSPALQKALETRQIWLWD